MKPDPSSSASNRESGIVLASASPRRSQLLAGAGISFSVVPSDAPEDVLPDETPQQHVKRLSLLKAREVARRREIGGRWFIGSDTVVVKDETILGKPADARDAAAVTTAVRFRELTDREIQGYIATGEPFGKAGAYAIQGIGACLIPAIEGSYTNVVGLPLCEVIETLEQLGAVRLFDSDPPRSAHSESPS
jgi:septum formation protein